MVITVRTSGVAHKRIYGKVLERRIVPCRHPATTNALRTDLDIMQATPNFALVITQRPSSVIETERAK